MSTKQKISLHTDRIGDGPERGDQLQLRNNRHPHLRPQSLIQPTRQRNRAKRPGTIRLSGVWSLGTAVSALTVISTSIRVI